MTSLTPTALNFEDVLRALSGPWTGTGNTFDQIAKRTGRDRSNLRRDLPKLVEQGLIKGDASLGWVRTEDGTAALDAIDRANGFVPHGAISTFPLDRIDYNPDNPRKSVAQEALEGLADSIAEAGGLLQPIVLYASRPGQLNRMLHAGERRVRACRLLQEEGRLPAALQEGLPFIEREASKAEALFIGLVENSQREDLSPFEDAKALKAYRDETGLSARQIAFKLGRAREGSEKGVRDVQEKIATMDRAAAEAIAQVEDGKQEFDWLKRQVRKRLDEVSSQLRPIDLMTIAEVIHKGRNAPFTRFTYGLETECAHDAAKDPVFKALTSQGVLRFTAMNYNDPRSSVALGSSDQISTLVETEELRPIYYPEGRAPVAPQALHSLRVAAVGEEKANEATQSGQYVSPWLNSPFTYTEEQQAKMAALKAGKVTDRAEAKRVRERDAARLQSVVALDERVLSEGLKAETVDKVRKAFMEKSVEFPLQPKGRGVADRQGRVLVANIGWQYQPREAELLQLICTVMNAALAPTPLEAAIVGASDGSETDAAA
jgi:ParB/RepB/Spo0J family partition protein